ncbi:MAG: hypothetical protein JWN22_2069, partial [Nocardioides sp.]|nr:hypothetical protein [Nocardioides sp.]
MSTELDRAVELLDRSLGYTRVVLADVTDHQLDHPTPCAGWSLKDLLRHMEDALDAFTEAAGGVVEVPGPGPATTGGGALQEKACALLGAWSRAEPTAVAVGDLELASPVLVAAAALEITVHGWDVGQATGHGGRIPEDLARDLLPVAGRLVDPADRGVRFARPRPTAAEAPYDARLLAFLGRHLTGPPGRVRGNRDTARAWLPSLALMQAPEVADLLSDPPGDTAPPSAPRPRALLHSGLARAWEQARLGQVNAALAALAALRLTGEIDPDSTDAVLLLATSIDCRLARGDLGDALALSEELAPYLEQPGARGAIAHHARGEVASALNEPDLAALHFTTAGQRVAADIGYADLVPWRAGAALAAVRLRRRPEAAAL